MYTINFSFLEQFGTSNTHASPVVILTSTVIRILEWCLIPIDKMTIFFTNISIFPDNENVYRDQSSITNGMICPVKPEI